MPRFRLSFQPKIAGAIFYVIESNEHVIAASWLRSFYNITSQKSFLVRVWISEKKMLRRLDETHRVEQALAGGQNANDMYRTIRSRQGCHPGRVEFGRPG